ncbi:drug/metabolite transporter (DMT)-like permease [Plasticicumulans lactativorans]|uniref:Drug/metabolite transporter (DMT)-like permease n=1 Tax=Plasticicumulans lactativorans TaxID=1133106 RepID=A0A4R2KUF4_9GAMM|nr:DMT family transporter [Plasticicumulans lactativorans]TCO77514.1 drug/metabolite transporter (DMT)-like permease [Plasticicumulans lactativorans]
MIPPRHRGVAAALAAAALFGAGTPLAKRLLAHTDPWLLAGLLYLGSGLGLWLLRRLRRAPALRPAPGEWRWLAGAIVAGGVLGPLLLMLGLAAMPAAGASLLLNAEGVLTALLAWCVFGENVDRRVALGMLAIVAGAAVLSWPGEARFGGAWPALAVLGACLAWAVDNNLTRKVALADASFIAMSKGLAAGATNLVLALLAGAAWPAPASVGAALLLGFASYGASLTLFVLGLRHLGTARTGAYFSVAPFFGAALALPLLGEALTPPLLVAGALMAVGVWLHLTERHDHLHRHEALEHSHAHVHGDGDAHHDHPHAVPVPPGTRHTHPHRHAPLEHAHPHYPDAHHGHSH